MRSVLVSAAVLGVVHLAFVPATPARRLPEAPRTTWHPRAKARTAAAAPS
jgi:hypothetical protein